MGRPLFVVLVINGFPPTARSCGLSWVDHELLPWDTRDKKCANKTRAAIGLGGTFGPKCITDARPRLRHGGHFWFPFLQ